MNLVTREKLLQGIAEATFGKSFCLSLPLDIPGGTALNKHRHPPRIRPVSRNGRPAMNYPMALDFPEHTDLVCDDMVEMHTQYSTQWDSLAHVGQQFDVDGDGKREFVYYNGFRAGEEIIGPVDYQGDGSERAVRSGARTLGIEILAESCAQGRAVMIDVEAHYHRAQKAIGYDELMVILEKDKVVVEPGDFVCIHTGFGQLLLDMKGNPDPAVIHNSCGGLAGRDPKLQQWVTDSGAVALISDNLAVEIFPPEAAPHAHCAFLPLHEHCLFRLGVHLGELWYLSELAGWLRANERSRFLLTAPPLRLPGAVGSPATPVATV
jgi:hypothetical protein